MRKSNAISTLKVFEIDFEEGLLMTYCDKFKALSDPIRLDILDELSNGELSAGDIASRFSLSHSKVSYHLSILKKVNMISERKYNLINGFEMDFKEGRKTEAYAKRVGLLELIIGIILLSVVGVLTIL